MESEYYSAAELRTKVGIKHHPTFLYNYLQPALAMKLLAMKQADRPNSPKQKYCLTQKGLQFKKEIN